MAELRRQIREQQQAMREQQESQLREQQQQRADMARQRTEAMQNQMRDQQVRASAGLATMGAGIGMGMRGMANRAMHGGMNPVINGREYISPMSGIERGYIAPAMGGALSHVGMGWAADMLYPNYDFSMAYGDRSTSFAQARAGGIRSGVASSLANNMFGRAIMSTNESGSWLGNISKDRRKQRIERDFEFMGSKILQSIGGTFNAESDTASGEDGDFLNPNSVFIGRELGLQDELRTAWIKNRGLSSTPGAAAVWDAANSISSSIMMEDRAKFVGGLQTLTGDETGAEKQDVIRANKRYMSDASKAAYMDTMPKLEIAGESLNMTMQAMSAWIEKVREMGVSSKAGLETLVQVGEAVRAIAGGAKGPGMFIDETVRRTLTGMQQGVAPGVLTNAAILRETQGVHATLSAGVLGDAAKAYGATPDEQTASLIQKTEGIRSGKLASLLTFAGGDGSLQERLARASGKLAADPLSYLREQSTSEFQRKVMSDGVTNVMNAFGDTGLPEELIWASVGQQGGLSMIDARNTYDVFSEASSNMLAASQNLQSTLERQQTRVSELETSLKAHRSDVTTAEKKSADFMRSYANIPWFAH